MFAQFSKTIYQLLANEDYKTLARNETHWILQKIEISTLITVHLVDNVHVNWANLLATNEHYNRDSEKNLQYVRQIASIFILVGGTPPPNWDSLEEYYGQSIYSVFWHLNTNDGSVTAPKGQPTKLFGLLQKINTAYKSANSTKISYTNNNPSNEANEIYDPNESPTIYETKIALRPMHKIPILTYGFILANAIILLLMYNAQTGNPQYDFWIQLRFGAILPTRVFDYGEWYRLFTAMFVHFGAMHFFANAFGIIIFGRVVEQYFGRIAFFSIYILSGLMGSVFSLYFSRAYSAGASGAVYGLIGAIFAYTLFTKRSLERFNWYMMFVWIAIGFVMGGSTAGIDNFGHLGGLVGGFICGIMYYFIKKAKMVS